MIVENKSGRVCLLGLLPEELQKCLPDFKSFKVREVFKNISRSLFSFEDYTTLTYTFFVQVQQYLNTKKMQMVLKRFLYKLTVDILSKPFYLLIKITEKPLAFLVKWVAHLLVSFVKRVF